MFYEIKVHLSTPIVFPANKLYPIHFDGILTALAAQKEGIADNPIPQEAPIIELPLNRTGGEKWVWKASCMEIDQSKSRTARDIWTSLTNWPEYVAPNKKTSINPGSGIYRAKTGLLMLLITPFVRFYIDTENINGVVDLLNSLTHIGNRIGAGYGEVRNIDIKKINEDYTLIDKNGYVARYIPVSEIEKPDPRWEIGYAGYRSPYYFYPLFDRCYIPPLGRYWPRKKPRDVIQELFAVKEGEQEND